MRRKADSRERPKYGQRAETWQLLSARDNNYDTLIWDRLAWLLTPRKGSSLRIEFGVHLDIG